MAAWLAGVPREVLAVHGRWRFDAVDVYLVADTELSGYPSHLAVERRNKV
jgi:hypothetical protein